MDRHIAHAAVDLNSLDGGNRKYILVEMEDYGQTVTAERVKMVINGFAEQEGTGGSFDFYELGQPMFFIQKQSSRFLTQSITTINIFSMSKMVSLL